ncbi:hypothetical protein [Clostridium rectalis]|uniref:hypothetical protein n=1 Tax=Clostridium rectalis TaxID=2040295 RepID=UPI000F62EC53|nr:hypothetical protein [Clostridium rectalis]
MKKSKLQRKYWNTTFCPSLRKRVNVTAAELNTTSNILLEVAYIYMLKNWKEEDIKKILNERQ